MYMKMKIFIFHIAFGIRWSAYVIRN